jgi:hypothetical protein
MTAITWTGAQDTDWFNANNWNPPQAPGSGDTVRVPAGLTNEPVVPDRQTVPFTQTLAVDGAIALDRQQYRYDLQRRRQRHGDTDRGGHRPQ